MNTSSPASRRKHPDDAPSTTWRITIGIWSCVLFLCYLRLAFLCSQLTADLFLANNQYWTMRNLLVNYPLRNVDGHYTLLNVQDPATATPKDIKDAFKRLAVTRHHDKRSWSPAAMDEYLLLHEAF